MTTSNVKMLPLPEPQDHREDAEQRRMQSYAHANVEANTEALRAEVERLTFEMGCLQQQYDERTAYMIVHRGAGLACSDAVRSAYSDEHHRAERLAEALRECRPFVAYAYDRGIVGAELAGRNLDSALEQENSDG